MHISKIFRDAWPSFIASSEQVKNRHKFAEKTARLYKNYAKKAWGTCRISVGKTSSKLFFTMLNYCQFERKFLLLFQMRAKVGALGSLDLRNVETGSCLDTFLTRSTRRLSRRCLPAPQSFGGVAVSKPRAV